MAQWMNLHWNNSFINRMQLPLLCEKSGAILLGFTAGSLAARHSAKILVDLEVFKILYGSNR